MGKHRTESGFELRAAQFAHVIVIGDGAVW